MTADQGERKWMNIPYNNVYLRVNIPCIRQTVSRIRTGTHVLMVHVHVGGSHTRVPSTGTPKHFHRWSIRHGPGTPIVRASRCVMVL